MTDREQPGSDLRTSLIEGLRLARAAEREIFAALDPSARDAAGSDRAWSAKDELAHLSAWRRRQVDRMAAVREGRTEAPSPEVEIDALNAILHAERADWTWERVDADATATAEALIGEIAAADDATLADPRVVGTIMGDGPEHDLAHLTTIAARVGLSERVMALADATQALIDRGGWPSRAAAFARYNLACFHALGGRLELARDLLRQALPAEEELRGLALKDDDLSALRDEIPALGAG